MSDQKNPLQIKMPKTLDERAIEASELAKPSGEASYWAKGSCKRCYGRGIVGQITYKLDSNTILNNSICSCAQNAFMRWRTAWIEQWKKEQPTLESANR